MEETEYSASEIRKILQGLFPHRRLVLSQFTFFNQVGVAKPTGTTFRRGRRCYRVQDLLSIASVLALKEEGIPYKNVEPVPQLIQDNVERIFSCGPGCRLSGFADSIVLSFPGDAHAPDPVERLLSGESTGSLFWGFDVGMLAMQLLDVARDAAREEILRAA